MQPAAMPDTLTGIRPRSVFRLTDVLAAEMVAATAGLGQMVLNASHFFTYGYRHNGDCGDRRAGVCFRSADAPGRKNPDTVEGEDLARTRDASLRLSNG